MKQSIWRLLNDLEEERHQIFSDLGTFGRASTEAESLAEDSIGDTIHQGTRLNIGKLDDHYYTYSLPVFQDLPNLPLASGTDKHEL